MLTDWAWNANEGSPLKNRKIFSRINSVRCQDLLIITPCLPSLWAIKWNIQETFKDDQISSYQTTSSRDNFLYHTNHAYFPCGTHRRRTLCKPGTLRSVRSHTTFYIQPAARTRFASQESHDLVERDDVRRDNIYTPLSLTHTLSHTYMYLHTQPHSVDVATECVRMQWRMLYPS